MTRIHSHMLSDIGLKRVRNEDAVDQYVPAPDEPAASLGQLFVLADGVGGLPDGDVASREAVREVIRAYYDENLTPADEFIEKDIQSRLYNAVVAANAVVYELGQQKIYGDPMATTLVMAAVRNNTFAVASVGDSPAFLLRDGVLQKLTVDHNFAEMQWRLGYLSYEEAYLHPDRNKLVRAIGSDAGIEVDIIMDTLNPGDCLLLCSDGLTRYVSERDITAIITSKDLENAVQQMVDEANSRGGLDNISVIAIRALNDDGTVPRVASSGGAVMVDTLRRAAARIRFRRRVKRLGLLFSGLLAFILAIMRAVIKRNKQHTD